MKFRNIWDLIDYYRGLSEYDDYRFIIKHDGEVKIYNWWGLIPSEALWSKPVFYHNRWSRTRNGEKTHILEIHY